MRQAPMPTIVALLSGAAGLGLAMQHPVAPATVTAMLIVCWIVFFRWPHLWLLAFPALLPVIGFAPWTGWLTFEEQDILVLAEYHGNFLLLIHPH